MQLHFGLQHAPLLDALRQIVQGQENLWTAREFQIMLLGEVHRVWCQEISAHEVSSHLLRARTPSYSHSELKLQIGTLFLQDLPKQPSIEAQSAQGPSVRRQQARKLQSSLGREHLSDKRLAGS